MLFVLFLPSVCLHWVTAGSKPLPEQAFGLVAKMWFGTFTLYLRVPGFKFKLHSQIQFLANASLRWQHDGSDSWVPATHGRSRLSFRLLNLTTPSPGFGGHLGNELADGNSVYFCLFLPISSLSQISVSTKKDLYLNRTHCNSTNSYLFHHLCD